MMAEKKFETGKSYMVDTPYGMFPAIVTKRTRCTVTFTYSDGGLRPKTATMRIDERAIYVDASDDKTFETADNRRMGVSSEVVWEVE